MDLDAGGEGTRPGGDGGGVHDQSPDREPEAQGGSRGDEPVRPEELEEFLGEQASLADVEARRARGQWARIG